MRKVCEVYIYLCEPQYFVEDFKVRYRGVMVVCTNIRYDICKGIVCHELAKEMNVCILLVKAISRTEIYFN